MLSSNAFQCFSARPSSPLRLTQTSLSHTSISKPKETNRRTSFIATSLFRYSTSLVSSALCERFLRTLDTYVSEHSSASRRSSGSMSRRVSLLCVSGRRSSSTTVQVSQLVSSVYAIQQGGAMRDSLSVSASRLLLRCGS
jgi:hypothetical protein